MFASELKLWGFRAFDEARIALRPAMTVLLGENSSGKSAAVDALRLLTDPLDARRSLWPDREDVCRATDRSAFTLGMSLRGTVVELAPYSDAIAPPVAGAVTADACYTLTYQAPGSGESRGRTTWTAGSGAVADDPDPGARGRLRHVYLPPLRDAARDLGPAGGPLIRAIIERLLDGKTLRNETDDPTQPVHDRASFQAAVGGHLRQIELNPVLQHASSLVNDPLSQLTFGAHEHATDLGYGREDMVSLIRGLRMRMADAGVEPRELAESGMGYANLAYIATVLTHLDRAAQADLTLLLVEEPEAHLHPQLQAVLLDFLTQTARDSQTNTGPGWLGRIQVIVTTHAPLLAAHTDVADVVVLQRRRMTRTVAAVPPQTRTEDSLPSAPVQATFVACAVAVSELGLSRSHLARVNRYLDATRSSLLFGPRTILVEGIAEALLLPAMADVLFTGRERTRFVGSTIVPIDGVDFEPYLRMLLTLTPSGRIGQRVAVLTDTDPGKRRNPITALQQLITSLKAGEVAKVFASPTTLEPELYEADNPAFWPAWAVQRPTGAVKVRARVEAASSPDERAGILISAMKKTRLRKGDFAQDLLDHTLPGGHTLGVPSYIRDALTWLVGMA